MDLDDLRAGQNVEDRRGGFWGLWPAPDDWRRWAVGDDTLQKEQQGYIVPDSFTPGTSAQRSRWFRRGLAAGDMNACDSFSAGTL